MNFFLLMRHNIESIESLADYACEQSVEKIVNSGGVEHPDIERFIGKGEYQEVEIRKDQEKISLAEKKFENEKKEMTETERESYEKSEKRGKALEVVLTHMLSRWLESDEMQVLVQPASRYDDVMNGTDLIIEFEKEDSVENLALAVDASLFVKGVEQKLERAHKKTMGRMGSSEIKYFESQTIVDDDGDYQVGPLKNVISTVVGLGPRNANKLFDSFAEYLVSQEHKKPEAEEQIDIISESSVKKIFVDQIKAQLDFYQKESDMPKEILDKIKDISTIFEDISNQMDDVVCSFEEEDDPIFQEIKNFSKRSGAYEEATY